MPEKVEWLGMFTYAYHHDVLLMIPKLSADVKPGEYELKRQSGMAECGEKSHVCPEINKCRRLWLWVRTPSRGAPDLFENGERS